MDSARSDVSYLYDAKHKIVAVQIPYEQYLDLIRKKRKAVLKDTVPGDMVGHGILIASINELREQGMTLIKIAKHLGVSQPYLSKLLRTPGNIGSRTLDKYLRKLDELAANR